MMQRDFLQTGNEHDFTKSACGVFKSMGAQVIPIVASAAQDNGLPDRIVVWRGDTWWFEFKDERTPLRGDQRLMLKKLHQRTPFVFIVRRRRDVIAVQHPVTEDTLFVAEQAREVLGVLFEIRGLLVPCWSYEVHSLKSHKDFLERLYHKPRRIQRIVEAFAWAQGAVQDEVFANLESFPLSPLPED